MRIAIIADPLDNQRAGVHTYTRELIQALILYDHDNEYILIRQKRRDDFPEVKQVVIRSSKMPIGLASLRLFFILPIIFRKLKVDAAFEPAHFGPFGVPKRAKGITGIHDLTPILFPEMHRWHSQFLQRVFLRGILRRTDLILSNSRSTTNDLHRLYPFTKNKTSTIHLGRDESFKPSNDPGLLQHYGIQQPYFLFTGTIEPRKNLLVLLDAFRRLRDVGARSQLVLAGGRGWKSKSFFEALHDHSYKSDIKVLGFVPTEHLASLYSMARAFVYPSLYEGFGLPVLEAMSCGTPCIVSNTSSLSEVGGEAAVYFNPRDLHKLADLMNQLLTDDAMHQDLSERSLLQSRTFSWERYVEQFKDALNQIVKMS